MKWPRVGAGGCGRLVALLAAVSAAVPAAAQPDDASIAALDLADLPAAPASAAVRPWKLDIEAAARAGTDQGGVDAGRSQLAIDFRIDQRWAPALSARFAARADRYDPLSSQAARHRSVGHVKEAYVSWHATPTTVVDLGRVNDRLGAATGYNPSDFFKAGAVDSAVSPDPESRRKNRLGSVVVRGQRLWATQSLALTLSPRLASRHASGDPTAGSELERSNGVDRWLLTGSARLGPAWQPQLLIYRESGQSPQAGLNLSTLFGDAVVAYAEWAGGRSASLLARSMGKDDGRAFRSRAAAGATWTLPIDLSLTIEAQFNGAGATASQWRELAAADPAAWGRALQTAVALQEPPTRRGWFARAVWRNLGLRRLDLSAFVQIDPDDGGRQGWLELRHRFEGFDVALQLQRQTGGAGSRFGALPERHSAQALWVYYQ